MVWQLYTNRQILGASDRARISFDMGFMKAMLPETMLELLSIWTCIECYWRTLKGTEWCWIMWSDSRWHQIAMNDVNGNWMDAIIYIYISIYMYIIVYYIVYIYILLYHNIECCNSFYASDCIDNMDSDFTDTTTLHMDIYIYIQSYDTCAVYIMIRIYIYIDMYILYCIPSLYDNSMTTSFSTCDKVYQDGKLNSDGASSLEDCNEFLPMSGGSDRSGFNLFDLLQSASNEILPDPPSFKSFMSSKFDLG